MQPLAGVSVLDLTQNVAGPFCTLILGDLGADVIKVERPDQGDEVRAWTPPRWNGESVMYLTLNRNKRSLALDVKAPEARPILDALVRRADVLVQSLRAGAVEALGIGPAAARAINQRLVYCSVTAFGTQGPLRDLPGYDPMMQAQAGLMSLTGYPGQPPVRAGTSLVDMGTGMWAAIGILAALRERDRTGQGSEVTTALFDTALAWVPYQLLGYLATGEVPRSHGSGAAMIVPYQAFATRDGHLMIAAPTNALFARLSEALGHPELAKDPRFTDNPRRVQHRDALIPVLAAATRTEPTLALLERLRAAGVPCAPIQTVDQVAADPQTQASDMLTPTPHAEIPDLRTVALPLRWDGVRPTPRRSPPHIGEHTAEILAGLGLGAGEIDTLRVRDVVEVAGAGTRGGRP
jgi:crotonobetainyl-CoA:carnitine CoA-transferase CaiB-like acyl-CoA transferase